MATRKSSTTSAKRTAGKTPGKRTNAPASMPKEGRDPKGGLTAKGREFFNQREGSHLRPGVKGAADTPEKMVRKGSFLRRHFTHPRGPMVDAKGEPTRLALSAQAWGEPLPKTMADAKKLADKGHQLLQKYHAAQEKQAAKSSGKRAGKKAAKRSVKGVAKAGTQAKRPAEKSVPKAAKSS